VGRVGYVVQVPLSTFTAPDKLLEQSPRDAPTVSEWTHAACQSPANRVQRLSTIQQRHPSLRSARKPPRISVAA
jgi:hypothetical protein